MSLAVAILMSASLSTGCQGALSALTPAQAEVTPKAKVATPSAKVSGELPPGTPDGLPLWPDAVVDSGEITEQGAFSLLLTTGDSYDEIIAGTGSGFEKAGWKVAASVEATSATVLEVTNDEYEGLITVYSNPGSNVVDYLLTPLASATSP